MDATKQLLMVDLLQRTCTLDARKTDLEETDMIQVLGVR